MKTEIFLKELGKEFWKLARRNLIGICMIVLLMISMFAPLLIAAVLFEKMNIIETPEIRMVITFLWGNWNFGIVAYFLGRALE